MSDPSEAETLERSGQAGDETFSSDPAGEPTEPCTRKEKTWIDFELLDAEDKPVANRRVRLTLPDGRVLEGTTDAEGLFGVDGIDPGECQLATLDLAEDQCEMLA